MKCPKCKFEWKNEKMVEGGKKSRRKITPEQQEKMQSGRSKNKKGKSHDTLE